MAEKKKKARGGTYKEYAEFKKSTRPVTIADMVPVKGKVMEAGVGGARKAAVEAARKLMQKMKGSKKTSQSGADKATEKLSKTKVPPSKLTPAELREAKTRFMNQRSEQLRPDSFVKVKEKGGKSEVVSYSVPKNKDLMPTSAKARAKNAARAKSEGFNRLPPAPKKVYAEEIERFGGMESLDDIGRVLKGHGIKFRRVGDELLIAEKVSKKFPTEMFSVKSGDAARVIQYLGY